MSFALTVGSDGQAATARVVWSVDGQTYTFRSDNNFLSWITTIFTVADVVAGVTLPDYRLLRPAPATYDGITGNDNTGAGNGALASVTGTGNSAFGRYALNADTAGNSNSAFGANALSANLIGSSNTAVGTTALQNNLASNNTAVGASSLFSNTTGSNNVAIGYNAMLNATTSARNVVIGAFAGQLITIAPTANSGGNVLLGYLAGGVITSGVNNIAIGRGANTTSQTGDNNISIGRDAGPSGATSINTIAIGRGAVAGAGGDGEIALGSATYPVLLSATAGLPLAQFLVIRLNGTQYKIALLDV